eukprot:10074509-Lingulodinium_polyedra.AAC.1
MRYLCENHVQPRSGCLWRAMRLPRSFHCVDRWPARFGDSAARLALRVCSLAHVGVATVAR